ncbi:MAG: hypothetical protein R6X19_04490 [Kiritimatiellia bacterium]
MFNDPPVILKRESSPAASPILKVRLTGVGPDDTLAMPAPPM